jgi:Cell wall-active antibiotics response 4TMS YvqF
VDRPDLRTDAERDRAVELLRDAAAEHSSVFGDVRRSGTWTVPERSKWGSVFGDVVLDLREAHVAAPQVTIDAGSIFGDVDLLVPEGVVVDVRSRTVFGDLRQETGAAGTPGAPHIVLVGGSFFGDVKVRARRLRERLAQRLLGGQAR